MTVRVTRCSSTGTFASTATRLAFRDDRDTPLRNRGGMHRQYGKSEFLKRRKFSCRGLDRNSCKRPVRANQLARLRMHGQASYRSSVVSFKRRVARRSTGDNAYIRSIHTKQPRSCGDAICRDRPKAVIRPAGRCRNTPSLDHLVGLRNSRRSICSITLMIELRCSYMI